MPPPYAAFSGAWLQQAARASVTPALAKEVPLHCSDDIVMSIRSSSRDLAALAERPDDLGLSEVGE